MQCAAVIRYLELMIDAPQMNLLLGLLNLKDAIYGNWPLDAEEPPTTLDQSAEASNLISFSSKIEFLKARADGAVKS